MLFRRFLSNKGVAFALSALRFHRRDSRRFARLNVIVSRRMYLTVPLFRFGRIVDLSFFVCPFNGRLAITRVNFFGVLTLLSPSRLYRRTVRCVFVMFDLVDLYVQRGSRFRRLNVSRVMRARGVNAHLFRDQAMNLRDVQVNVKGRFAKAVSRTFVRVNVRVINSRSMFLRSFTLLVTPSGFVVRAVSLEDFIVYLDSVLSHGKFQAVVTTGPINVQRISTGQDYQVTVASRRKGHGCFNASSFCFFFLGPFVCEEVVFRPLHVVTSRFYSLHYLLVSGIRNQLPTNFRSWQVSMYFSGTIRGIGVQYHVFRP